MMQYVPILFFVIVGFANCQYDGYHLLRTTPKSEAHINALVTLQNSPKVDFWAEPSAVGLPVDVFVNPESVTPITNYLNDHGLETEILFKDAEKLIQRDIKPGSKFGWRDYHDLQTINDWLKQQAEKYSKIATVITAGNSYEKRELWGLKIAYKRNLPIVFIEGGIHAREWISPATATWIIQHVLNTTSDLIKSFEWHVFPVINPDGYAYSYTKDRFWSKNRHPNSQSPDASCIGVDLNRNFPFMWCSKQLNSASTDDVHSVKKPEALPSTCRNDYPGPAAASEPEVKGLIQYLSTIADRSMVFFSLRSYGQILTYPYKYNKSRVPVIADDERIGKIADKAVRTVAKRSGTSYVSGHGATPFLKVNGTSLDYAYKINITFPYLLKMRDRGKYGFLLPKEEIISAAGEAYEILIEILRQINKPGYSSKSASYSRNSSYSWNYYSLSVPTYNVEYDLKYDPSYSQIFSPSHLSTSQTFSPSHLLSSLNFSPSHLSSSQTSARSYISPYYSADSSHFRQTYDYDSPHYHYSAPPDSERDPSYYTYPFHESPDYPYPPNDPSYHPYPINEPFYNLFPPNKSPCYPFPPNESPYCTDPPNKSPYYAFPPNVSPYYPYPLNQPSYYPHQPNKSPDYPFPPKESPYYTYPPNKTPYYTFPPNERPYYSYPLNQRSYYPHPPNNSPDYPFPPNESPYYPYTPNKSPYYPFPPNERPYYPHPLIQPSYYPNPPDKSPYYLFPPNESPYYPNPPNQPSYYPHPLKKSPYYPFPPNESPYYPYPPNKSPYYTFHRNERPYYPYPTNQPSNYPHPPNEPPYYPYLPNVPPYYPYIHRS